MLATFHYGPHESQAGDLHLPEVASGAVVCLLHGGFWRAPHGREQLTAVAEDLARRGHVVWNLGYRRLGETGGGWPGTLADVDAGIDHLAALRDGGIALDLARVVVAGHSAGGHLALWSAARGRLAGLELGARVKAKAVVGLAPVADLAAAHAQSLGRGAATEFLGGAPEECPERYAAASVPSLLPLGTRQLVVHGGEDGAVPIAMSRRYVEQAVAAGDAVELMALDGAGHMDFVDPASAAHAAFCRWLKAL